MMPVRVVPNRGMVLMNVLAARGVVGTHQGTCPLIVQPQKCACPDISLTRSAMEKH